MFFWKSLAFSVIQQMLAIWPLVPLPSKSSLYICKFLVYYWSLGEEVSQPVSVSQSSLSDQQTVPGSEQVQEDLLISPQSSSIGSVDEGITEGLPTLQGTSSTSAHVDDDDRLENVQYPYQLYIAPSTSSTERPSPNGPDRPFQCPTCGVRFTRIQNLKQHMLIHSGNAIVPLVA